MFGRPNRLKFETQWQIERQKNSVLWYEKLLLQYFIFIKLMKMNINDHLSGDFKLKRLLLLKRENKEFPLSERKQKEDNRNLCEIDYSLKVLEYPWKFVLI